MALAHENYSGPFTRGIGIRMVREQIYFNIISFGLHPIIDEIEIDSNILVFVIEGLVFRGTMMLSMMIKPFSQRLALIVSSSVKGMNSVR